MTIQLTSRLVTAFSNGACTLNAEDINSFSRELSSSESVPDCFTFGQDMPGTSCTEAYPATSTTGPCNSGPLNPKSIRAEGNCVFYAEANCEGSEAGVTLPGTPTCVDNGANIMSYKCVSAFPLPMKERSQLTQSSKWSD